MKRVRSSVAAALFVGVGILGLWSCGPSIPPAASQATGTVRVATASAATSSLPVWTGLGNLAWGTDIGVPNAMFAEFWPAGYRAISLAYGGGVWRAVLNTVSGLGDQKVLVGNTLPVRQIEQAWQEGFRVTSIAYGGGQWAAIVSQTHDASPQQLSVASHPPLDEINKAIEAGQRVTNVAYGGGTWVLIYSKTSSIEAEKAQLASTYPEAEIARSQAGGMLVQSLAYGDSAWVVLLAKTSMKDQRIESAPVDVKGPMIDLWETYDYLDIRLYYGEDEWYVVGRK